MPKRCTGKTLKKTAYMLKDFSSFKLRLTVKRNFLTKELNHVRDY